VTRLRTWDARPGLDPKMIIEALRSYVEAITDFVKVTTAGSVNGDNG
jgi:hypothetical protein